VFQQFGLSGNYPGILSEFEVALKSILLNAPPKHDSFVNILADNTVFTALDDIYNKIELAKWVTRNRSLKFICTCGSLHQRNGKYHHGHLETKLSQSTFILAVLSYRQCIFLTFLNQFLPLTVDHVLYIDTETILANLEVRWKIAVDTPDALFHWVSTKLVCLLKQMDCCLMAALFILTKGRGTRSCFLVMKLSGIDEIWMIAQNAPLPDIQKAFKDHSLDNQLILISVIVTQPSVVNILLDGFDMTLTHCWQGEHFPYHKVYPKAFMLYHNGNGNEEAYWNRTEWISVHPDLWGLMEYYIHLPPDFCQVRVAKW